MKKIFKTGLLSTFLMVASVSSANASWAIGFIAGGVGEETPFKKAVSETSVKVGVVSLILGMITPGTLFGSIALLDEQGNEMDLDLVQDNLILNTFPSASQLLATLIKENSVLEGDKMIVQLSKNDLEEAFSSLDLEGEDMEQALEDLAATFK